MQLSKAFVNTGKKDRDAKPRSWRNLPMTIRSATVSLWRARRSLAATVDEACSRPRDDLGTLLATDIVDVDERVVWYSLRERSYFSSEVSTRPYSSAPCFLILSR
jgi:hypothetical protein